MSVAIGGSDNYDDGRYLKDIPNIVAAASELKSPLALVRQLSLSLESGIFDSQEQQRMLRQISLTSEKALRLTDDLTQFIKLKDNLFNLEPINVCQLCDHIVKEMQPQFMAHDKSFSHDLSSRQILAVANRDLISRVIRNFADNAMHYSEEYSDIKLNVNTLDKGRIIRLSVRDYGPAINLKKIKNMKDGMLDGAFLAHRPLGSGLGVFLASQFAAYMQGVAGIIRHRDGVTYYVDLQSSSQMSLL